MGYSDKAHYFRSAFRQRGFDEAWITELRDEAIKFLQPVIAKVPRHFSDDIRSAYAEKGISLEWNLTTRDAYGFFFLARDAGLTAGQQSAAALLYACTESEIVNLVVA